MNTLKRKPPSCYHGEPAQNSPNRPIILSTGRGDVRISVDEAERLACELFRVAREVRNEDV